jgi:hypothetical protein
MAIENVLRSSSADAGDTRRTAIVVLLTALLTITLTAAQQAPPRPAIVEGAVRNLMTNAPIPDVRVTLAAESGGGPGGKSATTDSEGKFSIPGVVPGRYLVSATGTLLFRPRRNGGTALITVTEGQRLTDVQVGLAPTGVIAGRVVDGNRDPQRSVRVEALRHEYRDAGPTWIPAAQSTTDDRGEYRLFNLQPGSYYIRATSAGVAQTASVYYPGVADSQGASPVQVESGSEIGAVDVELLRGPEYSVRFKLGGLPVGSVATFTLQRRNARISQTQLARAETLPDNTFRLTGLAPGAYDVFVQVVAGTAQPRILTHAGVIPVNIGNADEDLGTIAVRQTISVTGRIATSGPLPSSLDPKRLVLTLRALDLPTPLTVSLRTANNVPGFNDDGTFTLPNVAAGRYQILLTGLPPDSYLVSAREKNREVLDTGFTVSGDQGPLELSIGGPGSVGIVEGTLVNALGRPVPSSAVVLVPAPEHRGNFAAFKITTSDQFGNFSIRSVRSGDYKAFAWEDLEPGIYMDPEFLRNFEARAEAVRVLGGSQSAVTVKVIPATP